MIIKVLWRFTRKSTNEPYSFFTIDATSPANNSFRFRKKLFRFIVKMTLTDEIKVLDDKIKENQDQHDLYREATQISVLSSKILDMYEYLTGVDLGYKPGVFEKVKL